MAGISKSLIATVLSLLLVLTIGSGLAFGRFDIKKTTFGMSFAQVKQLARDLYLLDEEDEDTGGGRRYSYLEYYAPQFENDVVASCRILYEFYDYKLVSIAVIKMSDTDMGAGAVFYDMYRKTTAYYAKLYGEPDVEHVIWRDQLVEVPDDFDRSNVKAGVDKGYVSCYSGWSAKDNDGYAAYTGVRPFEQMNEVFFEFYDVYRFQY